MEEQITNAAVIPEAAQENSETPKAQAEQKTSKEKTISFIYEVISVFATAVIILMLVFTFFLRIVGVSGNSMNPTLNSGDWVLIKQYVDYTPRYGDIVVVSQPNKYHENIIKRVIATEGQTIDIDFSQGKVYLDGNEIVEPYILNATTNYYDVKFPVTVPEGCCFVMGDNRQNSVDSRSSVIGIINNSYILGKAGRALTENGFTNIDLYDR